MDQSRKFFLSQSPRRRLIEEGGYVPRFCQIKNSSLSKFTLDNTIRPTKSIVRGLLISPEIKKISCNY